MTMLQLEVLEAFRSIDIPEDKAAKAAAALSTAFGRGDPEQDAKIDVISTDITVLKTDVSVLTADVSVLKIDMSGLKSDVTTIKLDNVAIRGELSVLKWMGGVLLTMLTAVLLKLFLH